MNQIKRSAFYTLLIFCLSAALFCVLMPYATDAENHSNFYAVFFLGKDAGFLWNYRPRPYLFAVLLLAFAAGILLLYSLLHTLDALQLEPLKPQKLKLGVGPAAGALFFLLLIVLSLTVIPHYFVSDYYIDSTPRSDISPTFWTYLGLLLSILSMELSSQLNRMLRFQQ